MKAKKRGPMATGKGTLVGVRLQPQDLKSLDRWIRRYGKDQSRPEAIRRLVSTGLVIAELTQKLANKRSSHAIELVGSKIDLLLNPKEYAELKVERLPR